MTFNPIKFEEQFSRLKSALQRTQAPDLQLLHLLVFWPTLKPVLNQRSFDSHLAEYMAILTSRCTQHGLTDLKPDELESMCDMLASLKTQAERFSLRDEVTHAHQLIGVEWAKKLFYVGQAESGLWILEDVLGDGKPADSHEVELPGGMEELDTLRLLAKKYGEEDRMAADQLRSILSDWELVREASSNSQAECLFVEKHGDRATNRGRLRLLQVAAEYASSAASSHEVTFGHQIKSPDDPFVGCIYQALAAAQKMLSGPDFKVHRGEFIHAYFHITPSDYAFTGDSIGLAAALAAFIQLLSSEVRRHERGIASAASFTGGIDSDGKILPVSNGTLQHKIARAFFSPVKYLVLPRGNLPVAQESLGALRQEYPRRRLTLIGVDLLEEVVDDRNIIRSEKVCPGQYVIRKAHAYSRATYIQIPLLVILTYILVCLLYPKAWLNFDWNPEHVMLNDARDRIMVYNRDTTLLWSAAADCPPVDNFRTAICDLDGDGRNEIIYMQGNSEAAACSVGGRFYAVDHDGTLLFHRSGIVIGEYEGDAVNHVFNVGGRIDMFQSADGPVILSNVAQNYPGRSHMKMWSASGDLLGWYVHAGHVRNLSAKDLNGDGSEEILALAINNPMGGMGLFVLPLKGCQGVSPPHSDAAESARQYTVGNQWHYVFFPSGDLVKAKGIPYNCCGEVAVLSDGGFRVQIDEDLTDHSFRSYFLDDDFRVTSVVPGDIWWERRQMFAAEGKIPDMTLEEFRRREMEQILYWTPDGWISAAQAGE